MFRAALLDVIENWRKFSSDTCPLKYSTQEAELWREEEKEWLDASESLEAFRQDLGINVQGWVCSEYYAESFARNQELRLKTTGAADDDSKNELWRVWPFKDDDDVSEWSGGRVAS
jgi:hypothetical protein